MCSGESTRLHAALSAVSYVTLKRLGLARAQLCVLSSQEAGFCDCGTLRRKRPGHLTQQKRLSGAAGLVRAARWVLLSVPAARCGWGGEGTSCSASGWRHRLGWIIPMECIKGKTHTKGHGGDQIQAANAPTGSSGASGCWDLSPHLNSGGPVVAHMGWDAWPQGVTWMPLGRGSGSTAEQCAGSGEL